MKDATPPNKAGMWFAPMMLTQMIGYVCTSHTRRTLSERPTALKNLKPSNEIKYR